MWLPYLEELQPAVQMLVCEECTDDDGSVALSWLCITLLVNMVAYYYVQ